MTDFSRISELVPLEHHRALKVVVAGVGGVGAPVALELARVGVGHLVLIDGDRLEEPNLVRHPLGEADLNHNKAEAMARLIHSRISSVNVASLPKHITDRVPDSELDRLFEDAALIVAATDNRLVQRRINRRALDCDIPAVFPGIDAGNERGEIFFALGRDKTPCYECWDGFRPTNENLRAVAGLGIDIYPTVEATVRLCLGILNPTSDYAAPFRQRGPDGQLPTLFFVSRPGATNRGIFESSSLPHVYPDWRENCPGCGGRSRRRAATSRPPPLAPTTIPPSTDADPSFGILITILALAFAVILGLLYALGLFVKAHGTLTVVLILLSIVYLIWNAATDRT